MTIVEINGIKLEVDERTAVTIDQYKVGDRLKVLVKDYSGYAVHPGVIIGFSNFKALPTIEIMYLSGGSYDPVFKFAAVNDQTKDFEIAPFNDLEALLDKQQIENALDRLINEARNKLLDLETRRKYFTTRFALAFDK